MFYIVCLGRLLAFSHRLSSTFYILTLAFWHFLEDHGSIIACLDSSVDICRGKWGHVCGLGSYGREEAGSNTTPNEVRVIPRLHHNPLRSRLLISIWIRRPGIELESLYLHIRPVHDLSS